MAMFANSPVGHGPEHEEETASSGRQVFDLRRVDHFEFCQDSFLKHEVGTLVRGR
ncbi:hypothetical protein [Streptomyces edwardsiae]|uniref:Uncharacterized protein n=1 Tax=Streptomyces edwardsiae TaxID=3075527 RepID=A0ABU2QMF9_9ACTN|nr:hypothetical protein [Streptomyces sp. DSM 41635]MDT0405658.1 hypothetical protein [Streptomyces sp. DSM 41635]